MTRRAGTIPWPPRRARRSRAPTCTCNERVARWNGWSLSAPRPGQPLNRSPDPALAADPDPQDGAAVTPFKMTTRFTAYPGSLPPLRFGDRYRLRVRGVDLAGHSVTPDTHAGDQFAIPGPGATMPYLRYEPVNPPVLVERALPGPGGSHAQLVIRSRNSDPSLDAAPSAETDERHVAPPRASVQLIEHHGMLDDGTGRLRADAAIYDLIVSRDRGHFATVGNTPLEPGEQLTVPYFPDPLAHGAAFAGLPHAEPVTHVSFGTAWPDRQPFRIRLADGTAAPAWDGQARVLTVSLGKAESATVPLSCYVDPADLEILGVWDWVRESFEQEQTAALEQGDAGSALVSVTDELAVLTQLTLAGGNEMITPRLSMSLVHAVQQPLGRPAWTRLPVVHHPEAPVAIPSAREQVLGGHRLALRRLAHGRAARRPEGPRSEHGHDRHRGHLDRVARRHQPAGSHTQARRGSRGQDPARLARGRARFQRRVTDSGWSPFTSPRWTRCGSPLRSTSFPA